MPSIPGAKTIPPSRRGKRQLIAFVSPELAQAAYDKANAERKTLQEILGDALNACFMRFNRAPVITPGHDRIVRRSRGRARVREGGTVAGARAGKRAISGWYPEAEVEKALDMSSEIGLPIQRMVEMGLEVITSSPSGQSAGTGSSETAKSEAA